MRRCFYGIHGSQSGICRTAQAGHMIGCCDYDCSSGAFPQPGCASSRHLLKIHSRQVGVFLLYFKVENACFDLGMFSLISEASRVSNLIWQMSSSMRKSFRNSLVQKRRENWHQCDVYTGGASPGWVCDVLGSVVVCLFWSPFDLRRWLLDILSQFPTNSSFWSLRFVLEVYGAVAVVIHIDWAIKNPKTSGKSTLRHFASTRGVPSNPSFWCDAHSDPIETLLPDIRVFDSAAGRRSRC